MGYHLCLRKIIDYSVKAVFEAKTRSTTLFSNSFSLSFYCEFSACTDLLVCVTTIDVDIVVTCSNNEGGGERYNLNS